MNVVSISHRVDPWSLLKNPGFDVLPLKGAVDFEELTESLKRRPDAKHEFFSKLLRPMAASHELAQS